MAVRVPDQMINFVNRCSIFYLLSPLSLPLSLHV
jgi:hypothetical protein